MKSFNIGDLKISVPIIQGGMGIGISLSRLASSVANMGGVGVISTVGIGLVGDEPNSSYRKNNIDAVREEIRKARELSFGALGVNIMTVLSNFSDMVKTSIEEGIDIIFSGAGLPLDLPKYLQYGIKTKLVPIVSSARAAAIVCKKWKQNYNYLPDALVVEGPKAGGHLGFKSEDQLYTDNHTLENLVTDVLKVSHEMKDKYDKDIPVIAAGGIYTGNDMYRIIQQGASAVQLGTRFVATEECDASEAFKNVFVDANDTDVKIIKSPVGMPGRIINNSFLDEAYEGKRRPKGCKHRCMVACDPKTATFCIAEALIEAYRGNLTDGFAFTGSNVGRVNEISTVRDIFTEISEEYDQAEKNCE
jgi:NAD(P)H-dependent flavin oxidoreductase YrpB (nitropropane dioxygenase family)